MAQNFRSDSSGRNDGRTGKYRGSVWPVFGLSDALRREITKGDNGDEGMTWTSSDASVAAVDGDGQLTGIAPSTATITVSCADGKVTGSTELKEVITITGVDAPETLELVINGGDEMLLNAKMTPEAATDASLAFDS